jgi:hypothetical protein
MRPRLEDQKIGTAEKTALDLCEVATKLWLRGEKDPLEKYIKLVNYLSKKSIPELITARRIINFSIAIGWDLQDIKTGVRLPDFHEEVIETFESEFCIGLGEHNNTYEGRQPLKTYAKFAEYLSEEYVTEQFSSARRILTLAISISDKQAYEEELRDLKLFLESLRIDEEEGTAAESKRLRKCMDKAILTICEH